MIKMALAELTQVLKNSVLQPCTLTTHPVDNGIHGVSTDSRNILPGNLFIAIKGDHFDGHEFVTEAAQRGASAALVSHLVNAPLTQLIVPDTLAAFGNLGGHWRSRFNIPFIAVTGSNGKTTVKNMIASILKAACGHHANDVLATTGNLNNHIGLPLNLLRLNPSHRYAVLEMGMNHFGEIAWLSQLVKPTVAVITHAAAAHLEGVGDLAGVARAKGEIFSGLPPDGTAILNRDDPYFDYWSDLIGNRSYLSFGLQNAADVTATINKGQTIKLQTPEGHINVTLSLPGTHNIMNALTAAAAALAVNIELAFIQQGLEQAHAESGRLQPCLLSSGTRVINDTYNANPASLTAAVDTLADSPGTKIMVLGDMKELGDNARSLHYAAGEQIRAAGIDYLFTLGDLSAETSKGFGENARHFFDHDTLITALKPWLKDKTQILIKGSRSMRMEQIISGIAPELSLQQTH
jgi:UDP-N-acetylmuramoyl-tripeptide--D-alanyl-D-alanine ligase